MLYNIIKQLQDTPSTNDKLSILKANKGNELLKEYLRLVCCPSVSFYITAKTFPAVYHFGSEVISLHWLRTVPPTLYKRKVTGNNAKIYIRDYMHVLDQEQQELFKMLLLKDIRAKVGATLVNKVWSNLCVSVPYMRCSLPDEKTLEKFKKAEKFIVQTKGDGMFASLVLDGTDWKEGNASQGSIQLFTRNGNKFQQQFAEYIANNLTDSNSVYEGELICFRGNEMLSRKEGNGILNSVMQGGEIPDGIRVHYYVWNRLPLADWKAGKTGLPYSTCLRVCFQKVKQGMSTCGRKDPTNMSLIEFDYAASLEEAYAFNNEQLAKGLEGSIIKTLTHKWRDGTSKECLKLKLAVEIDLIWYGSVEGNGKAAGMLGAMCLKSSCGKLVVDCGTGFTDEQRKQLWNDREALHGSVVTVTANDVLTKEGSNTLSLFLPVFVEVRKDKTQADDVERVHSMFNAAKYS